MTFSGRTCGTYTISYALITLVCDGGFISGGGGGGGGGGLLPYKGVMGTCGQPGYVFRDFCLKRGIEFIFFMS